MEKQSNNSRLKVRLRLPPTADLIPTQVIDFSPLGITLTSTTRIPLKIGDRVEISITQAGGTEIYEGILLSLITGEESKFTIRFIVQERKESGERRRSNRWICPNNFLPVAACPSPGQYNEFIEFQIRNISNQGLELTTAATNKFLVRGMLLRLTITLPIIGDVSTLVKIVRISVSSDHGTEILSFGAEIVDISPSSEDLIAQYLLQFSGLSSIGDFRNLETQANLHPKLWVGTAKTFNDYTALIDAGGLGYDWQDLQARIVVAKWDNAILAWAAFRFPNHNYSPTVTLPTFVRPDQIIEVTVLNLLATDLETVGSLALVRYLSNHCLSSQRTFIAISGTKKSTNTLTKCGFQVLAHDEFLGHPIRSLTEAKVSIMSWNLVWSDTAEKLLSTKIVSLNGIDKRMYFIFRLFRRAAHVLFSFSVSTTKRNAL
jgi:hypothetical protein